MATDWFTTREAAGLCRLSVSRFNELAAASRLPFGGRRVRLFDRAVLDGWIRRGMRPEFDMGSVDWRRSADEVLGHEKARG